MGKVRGVFRKLLRDLKIFVFSYPVDIFILFASLVAIKWVIESAAMFADKSIFVLLSNKFFWFFCALIVWTVIRCVMYWLSIYNRINSKLAVFRIDRWFFPFNRYCIRQRLRVKLDGECAATKMACDKRVLLDYMAKMKPGSVYYCYSHDTIKDVLGINGFELLDCEKIDEVSLDSVRKCLIGDVNADGVKCKDCFRAGRCSMLKKDGERAFYTMKFKKG